MTSDPPPAVLSQRWRPVTIHRDGRVELGPWRTGPARSDELFPPVTVRLTVDQFGGLAVAVWADLAGLPK